MYGSWSRLQRLLQGCSTLASQLTHRQLCKIACRPSSPTTQDIQGGASSSFAGVFTAGLSSSHMHIACRRLLQHLCSAAEKQGASLSDGLVELLMACQVTARLQNQFSM